MVAAPTSEPRRQVLNPIERISEILFGLIMVLTFTGSLSVAESGRADVRAMLVGAVGCNLAWGLIDAVFYLMNTLAERGRGLVTLRYVRSAVDPDQARRVIAEALPSPVSTVLLTAEIESIRSRLAELPEPPPRVRLQADDLRGALAVFALVFLSTFPVAMPFLLLHDPTRALRVSNAIAIALLFVGGYRLAHYAGGRPWLAGCLLVTLGSVLVWLTILLGG